MNYTLDRAKFESLRAGAAEHGIDIVGDAGTIVWHSLAIIYQYAEPSLSVEATGGNWLYTPSMFYSHLGAIIAG